MKIKNKRRRHVSVSQRDNLVEAADASKGEPRSAADKLAGVGASSRVGDKLGR